jgi:sulfate-transporting ATPase
MLHACITARGRAPRARFLRATALLDEPSNDLGVETRRALEDALPGFAGSVMVISHHGWFLDRIATHILSFEGNSQVTFFDGELSGIRGGQEEAPG